MGVSPIDILYPLCAFAFTLDVIFSEPSDPVALAKQWAPKIYLHSKEQFFPGDVESFLKEVTIQGSGCQAAKGIPTGTESTKCYLTTKGEPYDLLENKNSFLYGTKPDKPVPAYAFAKSCGSPDHLIIEYWIFFPFNKGKDMCGAIEKTPILKHHLNCEKNNSMVGNHVGDWEHLSVELKGGQPISLFLSVHDGGVYYNYDKKSNTFIMTSNLKHGVLKVPDPPKTINLAETHPILYCAEGSHAVWAAAGK